MPYVRRKKVPRSRYRRKVATKRVSRKALTGPYWSAQKAPRNKISLWGDSFQCKLRYSVIFAITSAGSTYVSLRGNGPYDPETAVGGSQPVGFDQFCPGIYWEYYATGSTCQARLVQGSTPIATRIVLYPTATASTSAQDASQPYAKSKILSAGRDSTAMLKSYFTTNRAYGIDTRKESDFKGSSSTVPAKEWYWHVRIGALDGTSSLSSYLVIDLTYYVTFFNRVKLLD